MEDCVLIRNIPVMGVFYNNILENLTGIETPIEFFIESGGKFFILKSKESYSVRFYIDEPKTGREVTVNFLSLEDDDFTLLIGYMDSDGIGWLSDIRGWYPIVHKLIGELVKIYPDICK